MTMTIVPVFSVELTVLVTGEDGGACYLSRTVPLPFRPQVGDVLSLDGPLSPVEVEYALWDAPAGMWRVELADAECEGTPRAFAFGSAWRARQDI